MDAESRREITSSRKSEKAEHGSGERAPCRRVKSAYAGMLSDTLRDGQMDK